MLYCKKKDMKVEELRIGNWINLITDGHEQEPDTFQWALYDYDLYKDRMEDCKPIPLTEEWLLKFGFESKQNGLYKPFKGGCIRLNVGIASLFIGSDYSLNTAMDYDYVELPNEIEYVHQLQNLYFALTGEELEIK